MRIAKEEKRIDIRNLVDTLMRLPFSEAVQLLREMGADEKILRRPVKSEKGPTNLGYCLDRLKRESRLHPKPIPPERSAYNWNELFQINSDGKVVETKFPSQLLVDACFSK